MNQKVPPNSSMVFDLPLSNRSGWDRLVASCSSEAGAVTGEQDRRSHRRSSLAMVFAVGSAEATSVQPTSVSSDRREREERKVAHDAPCRKPCSFRIIRKDPSAI